jgi:isoleucyl-tRNA synthetase
MQDKNQNYKDSIFLPKTNFPMKGNLPELARRILAYWDKINIYKLIKEKKTTKRFLFHYGPPFANNNFHLGHGLTITLKDIIARFYTMMDYEVPILQGHDCHGYPIEIEIQKLIEKESKKDYTIKKIREMCREYAYKWSQIHKEQTKMLGVLTNIKPINDNEKSQEMISEEFYSTMDKEIELDTYKIFSQLIMDGKVYRGMKPVMWSINEQSTLAEVDVIYKNKKSTSVYVKVKITKTPHKELEDSYVIFWTTTPWTLISNLAVAYNENITYGVIYIDDSKCYVAKELEMDLIRKWENLYTITESEITIKGNIFKDSMVEHPLIDDHIVPLISGDHVEDTSGTGFVHTAPDHGEDDFNIGEKYNLGLCDYVEGDGYYKEDVPILALANKHIFKDENIIIDLLLPKLVSKEIIEHSYPFSDRTTSPLIYLCTEQIFINLKDHKEEIINSLPKVKWFPEKGINRITAFVKNRLDWCVSRQRVWGNPLLIFVHKQTGDVLKNKELQENIFKEIKKNGTDHLLDLDWNIFLPENLKENYRPVYGILDVWFDSGATFKTVIEKRFNTNVSDLYLEGSDQHRGWFQSSLAVSMLTEGHPPYKNIVTHGFLVDEKGMKISKSKKNGLPLEECLEAGVDIIRVWVATCDYYEDIRISKEIFEDKKEIYRKIRNVLRYLLGAIDLIDGNLDEINYEISSEDIFESYILHKGYLLQKSVENHMLKFEIKNTFDEIFKFIQDLSSFYLDIKKDILYCDYSSSKKRHATRKTQYLLLELLLRLLAPIIPFTVEEVSLELGRSSYHTKNIFLFNKSLGDEKVFNFINELREKLVDVKIAIENARKNKIINTNNEAIVYIPVNIFNKKDKNIIQEILMVSDVIFIDDESKDYNGEINNIKIEKTSKEKCDRCWRYIGNLCERCKGDL